MSSPIPIVYWAATNGGNEVVEPVDHGNNTVSGFLPPITLFLSTGEINPLTNCKFYIRPYSASTYNGSFTAIQDFNTILSWGTQSGVNWGGFLINMNAVSGFASYSWPTSTSLDTADGNGHTFRAGFGDNLADAISLTRFMYNVSGINGNIPAGTAPNVSFQSTFQVPLGASTGIRMVEQVLVFSYTS